MGTFQYLAENERATDRLAAALAEQLPAGTTVALVGTLGAGKTRLVQGIAAALGVPRDVVTSPTFVLRQQYHGRRTIEHLDAYRLRDLDEFLELGVDELFASEALVFIEWADRVAGALPPDRVEIEIEAHGPAARSFVVRLHGAAAPGLAARLERHFLTA